MSWVSFDIPTQNKHQRTIMDNTAQSTGLRSILDLLVDSRESYMELCNRVDDTRTKDFLNALSWERIALETALMAEVRRMGPASPQHKEQGAAERPAAWKEVRAALSNANGAQVLPACERGEGYLLMRYDEVLQGDEFDITTRTVLTLQRAQVHGNLNNARSRTKRAVLAGI